MHFNIYSNQYAFDKGQNLIQQGNARTSKNQWLIPTQRGNQAISSTLYQSLGLNSTQKLNLRQTLIQKNIFDSHGNQLISQPHTSAPEMSLQWDYRNMLQSSQIRQSEVTKLREYSIYARTGQRNRKVSIQYDQGQKVTQITESLYLNNLEYRTIWKGTDLVYDGESVTDQGMPVSPYESYGTLRLCQGHRQIATLKHYSYRHGLSVYSGTTEIDYTLSDKIDSCSLALGGHGKLESYNSYQPYGTTAISYGKTQQQPYKYSGQEKDAIGLYYYGYRSLLSTNFRWTSPDPIGLRGSGLNWYAMVGGNPVTMRDELGLMLDDYRFLYPGIVMGYMRKNIGKGIPNTVKSLVQSFLNISNETVTVDKNTFLLMKEWIRIFPLMRAIYDSGSRNQHYYTKKLVGWEAKFSSYKVIETLREEESNLAIKFRQIPSLRLKTNGAICGYLSGLFRVGYCHEYVYKTLSLIGKDFRNNNSFKFIRYRFKAKRSNGVDASHEVLAGFFKNSNTSVNKFNIVIFDYWAINPQVSSAQNYKVKFFIRGSNISYTNMLNLLETDSTIDKINDVIDPDELHPEVGRVWSNWIQAKKMSWSKTYENEIESVYSTFNQWKSSLSNLDQNDFDSWDASKPVFYCHTENGETRYIPRISYSEASEQYLG